MTIDLDALEKLANRISSANASKRFPHISDLKDASDGMTALIAELKEARAALEPFAAHFVIYQANTPPMTVIPITTEYRHIRRAFLARNGKGEG